MCVHVCVGVCGYMCVCGRAEGDTGGAKLQARSTISPLGVHGVDLGIFSRSNTLDVNEERQTGNNGYCWDRICLEVRS